MVNNTRVLLNLKDENINFADNCIQKDADNGLIRVFGTLDYRPKACYNCGILNDNQIIKYGWRTVSIRLPRCSELDTILKLRKRYFHCKECHTYFLAQTKLVNKNCSISENTRVACLEKLLSPSSMNQIASELNVSPTYICRILDATDVDFKVNLNHLPKTLLMDEIQAVPGHLSFEYMDGETNKLLDLVETRTSYQIAKYFNRFTLAARENVKIIVTDMNYTYPKFAGTLFPNAIVVYDRFHIVNSLMRAFNKTRIQTMKNYATTSNTYKILKRYWKLLLQPMSKLNYKVFHKWTYFSYPTTATAVVDHLLSLDQTLSTTYQLLQRIMASITTRDWDGFEAALHSENKGSTYFEKSLHLLIENEDSVKNAINYPYSNGPLEGTNNKIKIIKRNAYGFSNFRHFRNRVFFVMRNKQSKKGIVTK